MALELKLSKPGDTAPKLSLNLAKPARFTVELYWESAHDLDAHALLATNSGAGAKVTSFDQVLSTYNAKKTNPQGTLVTNAMARSPRLSKASPTQGMLARVCKRTWTRCCPSTAAGFLRASMKSRCL